MLTRPVGRASEPRPSPPPESDGQPVLLVGPRRPAGVLRLAGGFLLAGLGAFALVRVRPPPPEPLPGPRPGVIGVWPDSLPVTAAATPREPAAADSGLGAATPPEPAAGDSGLRAESPPATRPAPAAEPDRVMTASRHPTRPSPARAAGPARRDRAPSPGDRSMPAEGTGRLSVSSEPWGRLFIDGDSIGDTPLADLRLAPGRHTIEIRHSGYGPLRREVWITAGEEVRLIGLRLEAAR